jgi:hypothetical protein
MNKCTVQLVGSNGGMESYFLFRLVLYGISPLSLICVAFASHFHQKKLLQRLTGLPHAIPVSEGFHAPPRSSGFCSALGKDEWLSATATIVFSTNVVMGAISIANDIMFLMRMAEFAGAGMDNPTFQDCSHIVRNEAVGGMSLHVKPSIADVPIPVVLFNFIYTLWGVFYCIAINVNSALMSDSGSTELKTLLRETSHMAAGAQAAADMHREDVHGTLQTHAAHRLHVPHLLSSVPHLLSSAHPTPATGGA